MLRNITVLGLVAASCLVLTGCSLGSGAAPRSSAPPTQSRAPLNVECSLFLKDADAAALTPPLQPIPSYKPGPGTPEAAMVGQGGRACGWGTDSVASLVITLAIPGVHALAAARKAASTGEPMSPPQVDVAYFARGTDGIGREQIFLGSEWLEIASPSFATADDAAAIDGRIILTWRSAGG